MSLTLPIPAIQRPVQRDTIRGVVRALGNGFPVWTVEVEMPSGKTETIWQRGYRVGDVVAVEWRSSGDSRFLAACDDPGGGAWLE